MYDVVIIGAGVTGSAIARELSRYELKLAVLEREEDVCCGTSKANSGIVHSGFDAKPGTMKARMNVRGNELMEELAEKLDFPFVRNGSLVLCFREEDRARLEILKKQGEENGVPGLQILEKEEVRKREPHISDAVVCALYAPTGGIVCPFKLNIALAENAYVNGAEFLFDTEVTRITKTEAGYKLQTKDRSFSTKVIVNAAGVYADVFHNMVSEKKLHITVRKGEYCLFDKKAGGAVHSTIFQMPTKMGKGILVTPTVHGNLLMGPTAADIEDREGVDTSAEGLSEVLFKAAHSLDRIPTKQVITSFAGLRAHEDGDDFVLGEVCDAAGFFDAAGIESPGLSSAPAIGEYIGGLVAKKMSLKHKHIFVDSRMDTKAAALADSDTLHKWIEDNPLYGNVICRCETVTEAEIVDAIRRPLGAKSLDGVKRRTRAGMGRCQAGFCSTKVMEILARELAVPQTEITKAGDISFMLSGKARS